MSSNEILNVKIFTLFPGAFPGTLGLSVIGNALRDNKFSLDTINIRDFAVDKHHSVDDTPFGGGAGMVLKAEVIDAALSKVYNSPGNLKTMGVELFYMSPRGEVFDQTKAKELSTKSNIGIICGRFEGIDQRVLDKWNIKELSIGDYVLAGGEAAAQVVLEAVIRLRPDVLGCDESLLEESFSNDLLEYPQYTKPREWQGIKVPEILLSGDHARIKQWRKEQAENLTKSKRPDLWSKYTG